jgi:hypothetical protein
MRHRFTCSEVLPPITVTSLGNEGCWPSVFTQFVAGQAKVQAQRRFSRLLHSFVLFVVVFYLKKVFFNFYIRHFLLC